MNISTKMQTALNKQINKELYSSYIYISMAGYFEQKSLGGFSSWMKAQAKEEVEHAMKLWQFVHDRGGKVVLDQIAKPSGTWTSPLNIAQTALKHEQSVTKSIHDLVKAAVAEKDTATQVFLNWFVDEQVEEENNASELVDKVSLVGNSGHGLLILDKELSERK